MVTELNSSDPDFEQNFSRFLGLKRSTAENVTATVTSILSEIQDRGDDALFEFARKFDGIELTADNVRVSADELQKARQEVDAPTLEALEFAHKRIYDHHLRQLPKNDQYVDKLGVELGSKWTPVESVGLYVPGGTATYPSSVLMNAIPARVAGVNRIVMVHPARSDRIAPLVLAAASVAGIDEIYRIGGAQAVGALAFGTRTIAPVSKIVGPGNAYVAEAKRQVFGHVGIDMIAGPSEVVVVADETMNPDWIAADLLAQAEHDTAAQSVLITDNVSLADAVRQAVDRMLKELKRGDIATQSWQSFGAIIVVAAVDEAPALINRLAPEHLQLALENPDALVPEIHNAGAIFLGRETPEVIGDYVGGSNHVLPTSRTARFSSGLGVLDFMKRTSLLKLDQKALKLLGPHAMLLADAEGLEAHKRSVAIRLPDAG